MYKTIEPNHAVPERLSLRNNCSLRVSLITRNRVVKSALVQIHIRFVVVVLRFV